MKLAIVLLIFACFASISHADGLPTDLRTGSVFVLRESGKYKPVTIRVVGSSANGHTPKFYNLSGDEVRLHRRQILDAIALERVPVEPTFVEIDGGSRRDILLSTHGFKDPRSGRLMYYDVEWRLVSVAEVAEKKLSSDQLWQTLVYDRKSKQNEIYLSDTLVKFLEKTPSRLHTDIVNLIQNGESDPVLARRDPSLFQSIKNMSCRIAFAVKNPILQAFKTGGHAGAEKYRVDASRISE